MTEQQLIATYGYAYCYLCMDPADALPQKSALLSEVNPLKDADKQAAGPLNATVHVLVGPACVVTHSASLPSLTDV